MERLRVVGGARLAGEIRITGAKNSALKLMAASLLAEGRTTLRDVPAILDVAVMSELLRRMGAEVAIDQGVVRLDVPGEIGHEADYDLVRRLRASICVLGPLLARCGQAHVAYPGGDAIGSRGLDMHISGLVQLGAEIDNEHGFLVARAPDGLAGARLRLEFPSVGATENILMAAVLAKGTTVIDNAAREPEIVDLCQLLAGMGAKIGGVGTSTLEVLGVDRLAPIEHRTVPDRIVAGTFAVAAVMTRGDVVLRNARQEHLQLPLDKLTTAGATVEPWPGQQGEQGQRDGGGPDLGQEAGAEPGVRIRMDRRPRAVDIVTLPYPGFATDLQPAFAALNAVADGAAMVTENLFEARFVFLQELARLGANVRTDGHHAILRGRERLSGAPVQATDIRAGAGLVLAGLVADGVTTVGGVRHIDRGYAGFVDQLRGLGADVSREADPEASADDL